MYLQSNDFESTNSSLSMFDLQAVNSVECGSLWLSTKCCKELLYSKPSQRCIGVHFLDFRSNSLNIPLFFPTYEGSCRLKKVCVSYNFFLTAFGTELNNVFFFFSFFFLSFKQLSGNLSCVFVLL